MLSDVDDTARAQAMPAPVWAWRWRRAVVGGLRAGLCAVAMGAPIAAAQPAPKLTIAPTLTIALAESGKEAFAALVPAIATASRLTTPLEVKSGSALGVLKEFCEGVGGTSPDIVLTSRRMRSSMVTECSKNGVDHIAGVILGRSAMVLAVRSDSALTGLTVRQVYLALARDVPEKGAFRRNSAILWSEIDPGLPERDIRFHIPPRRDSGRAAFNALVLEGGCREVPQIRLISGAELRVGRCVTPRLERVREIPRAQAVAALLEAPQDTVGVISLADLLQSGGKLVGLAVGGIAPEHDTVVQGTYDFASTYYLYAKRGQRLHGGTEAKDLAIDRVIADAVREPMVGPGGQVAKLGLIPLSDADRAAQRAVFTVRADTSGLGSVMGWLGYAADGLRNLFDLGTSLTVGTQAEAGMDFIGLMELAGYKTKEIQTSISLIPAAGMTFGIVREMSEADQDYLDRRLIQDERERRGALAAIQRRIVRSVLDVSETADFEISKVEIEFVPLPSAKFIISPSDAPISWETASILRAIERLGERVSELTR